MAGILEALLLDLPERVEAGRLVLRATHAGDGAASNAAFVESHAELKPWMPWAVELQTEAQSEEHCRRMQARWIAREELDFCFLGRDDGAFLGKGGLHTIDWTVPKFEIGYWIRTSAAGKGLATEAAGVLVELARERLGARRLEIRSDARNAASRRVAEKSGFVLEGIRRQARRDNAGELADECIYAKIL